MDYTKIAKAGEQAYTKIDKALHIDRDVQLYKTLDAASLQKLSDLYGKAEVEKYVREMESRSVTNG